MSIKQLFNGLRLLKGFSLIFFTLGALIINVPPAFSHAGSTGYLQLDQKSGVLFGEWLLPLIDMEIVVGINDNDDDQITAEEVDSSSSILTRYAQLHLIAIREQRSCPSEWHPPILARFRGTIYLRWDFAFRCPGGELPDTLKYHALFVHDSQHRAITYWANSSRVSLFSPTNTSLSISGTSPPLTDFISMAREGVIHVLAGYDHLLFLFALIVPLVIPAVVPAIGSLIKSRTAVTSAFRDPTLVNLLRKLLTVVTAFTLGHSVTLCFSILSGWSPATYWVELAIASTVVIAGANIVFPFFREGAWPVALLFGFIHGFGFASVLRNLSAETGLTVAPLLSFNLGVELGQVVVLLICCPLLVAMARSPRLSCWIRPGVSTFTILMGVGWMIQRSY